MKVSLTLAALERLIAGDTEIEVEIRHQIAENFAKRHLKTILNDATWQAAATGWRETLDTEIRRIISELATERGKADKLTTEATFAAQRWPLRDAIEKAACKAVDVAVQKVVDSQQRYMQQMVQSSVNTAMEKEIEKQVQAGIQARLKAATAAMLG
jgi:phosphopantetheinyl transferase (holo-ACP synthase)